MDKVLTVGQTCRSRPLLPSPARPILHYHKKHHQAQFLIGNYYIEMRLEEISEDSKRIISAMRSLIDRGETAHRKENSSGWQYGGEKFIEMVASLEKGIKQELESQNIHVSNRSTCFESIVTNRLCRRSLAALCDIFLREPILSHPILRSSY